MLRLLAAASTDYVKDIGAKDLLPSHSASIGGALANVVTVLIGLVGLLSVIFVVVGALQMAAAAGSPQRFKQARETIIYAIIGIVVSIAAYAIVTFVSKAFSG